LVAATTPPQPPPKITIRFRPLTYAMASLIYLWQSREAPSALLHHD
jgi:hypothetical protein